MSTNKTDGRGCRWKLPQEADARRGLAGRRLVTLAARPAEGGPFVGGSVAVAGVLAAGRNCVAPIAER